MLYCTGEAGVPRDQHHRACALRHLAARQPGQPKFKPFFSALEEGRLRVI